MLKKFQDKFSISELEEHQIPTLCLNLPAPKSVKEAQKLHRYLSAHDPPTLGCDLKSKWCVDGIKKRYKRHFNDSVIKDYTPAVTTKPTIVIGGDQKAFQNKLLLKIHLKLSPRDCWHFSFFFRLGVVILFLFIFSLQNTTAQCIISLLYSN